jgi:carbon storage regulator
MLVLTRKPGEAIWIGETIRICLVAIDRGRARVGIQAPREIPIEREEIRTEATQGSEPQ